MWTFVHYEKQVLVMSMLNASQGTRTVIERI